MAYIKTKNLMFPTGIHLGWNYAQELIPQTAGGKNSAFGYHQRQPYHL